VVTQREGPKSVGGVEEDYLLGKLPPKRYLSDIAIKAATYIDQAAIDAVPLTFAWGTGITFQMFLNDRLGDCTCASRGHHNQVVSMRAKHPETHTDDQIFKLYHNTGLEQGLSDQDGRYMEGVLSYEKRVGIEQEGKQPDQIIGYAGVNYKDHGEVRAATFLFGGLYIGIALPLSARSQFYAHHNWAYVQGPGNAPGSWGGHAVNVTSINKIGPVVATWARRQQLTWGFWDHYVDESYAVLHPDWVQNVKAPSGFSREDLIEDLAAL